jgi:hypothetical protein
MKAVVGWLCDPYIHLLVVGLVLVRLAMGAGGDRPTDATGQPPVRCAACRGFHMEGVECIPIVVNAQATHPTD